MKKSLHSILTAAMFAAAVTTSVGNPAVSVQSGAASAEAGLMQETEREMQGAYGPPNWFTETEMTKLTDTEPQDVYGPPNWFSETETLTTTDVTRDIPPTVYGPPNWFSDKETEATVTTTTDVTEINPQPAYGPPWVSGDLNTDFQVDARDLTLLKRMILDNNGADVSLEVPPGYVIADGRAFADMNGDGKLDKADVKALVRMLTGKPEKEDDPQESTVTSTATTVASLITTTSTPVVSLYGPRFTNNTTDPVYKTTASETLTTADVTEPVPQPEYGAPVDYEEK